LEGSRIPAIDGQIVCAFADTTNNAKRDVAQIFETYRTKGIQQNKNAAVLATCQRLEVYSAETSCRRFEMFEGREPELVIGDESCLARLAEIAAGLRSEIIGERFIYNQVEQAFSYEDIDPSLKTFAERALSIARVARTEWQFCADFDYDDITFAILESGLWGRRSMDAALIVLGSGMLAQAIVQHPSVNAYKIVHVATRSPKSARKRFPGTVAAVRADRLPSICYPAECDVVVATTNLTEEHRALIARFLQVQTPRVVVDLSSTTIRLSATPDNYVSMYDEHFARAVDKANHPNLACIDQMAQFIRQKVAAL
jgi:glutamyl-tRNA reductase